VATVATEPKTVIRVIPAHDNLTCSIQAKLQVSGSYLKGKIPANAIVLGASHSQLSEGPQKGPIRRWLPLNGIGRQWIPRRDFLAGFPRISSDFADSVDVRGPPRTLLDGGPCRDRTYDQLIKSQLLYQLS
jgi:hypothetical protein